MPALDPLREALLQLERRLLDPAIRANRVELEALLAEDFTEFGSSGRVFNRVSIIAELAEEGGRPERGIEDFRVVAAAADLVVVSYRIAARGSGDHAHPASFRSSTWVLRDGRWQLRFHQGTRAASPMIQRR